MIDKNYVESVLYFNKDMYTKFPKKSLYAPYEPARSNLFVVSENSLNIDKQYISEVAGLLIIVGPDYYNYNSKIMELTILDSIEFNNFKRIFKYITDIKQDKIFNFKVDCLSPKHEILMSMKINSTIYSLDTATFKWDESTACSMKLKCEVKNVEII